MLLTIDKGNFKFILVQYMVWYTINTYIGEGKDKAISRLMASSG